MKGEEKGHGQEERRSVGLLVVSFVVFNYRMWKQQYGMR